MWPLLLWMCCYVIILGGQSNWPSFPRQTLIAIHGVVYSGYGLFRGGTFVKFWGGFQWKLQFRGKSRNWDSGKLRGVQTQTKKKNYTVKTVPRWWHTYALYFHTSCLVLSSPVRTRHTNFCLDQWEHAVSNPQNGGGANFWRNHGCRGWRACAHVALKTLVLLLALFKKSGITTSIRCFSLWVLQEFLF